jgi:hypothetical protein
MRLFPPETRRTLLSLVLITALGFGAKLYPGPGRAWVNDSFAGFFYVLFWCLLVMLVSANARPVVVALSVLVATCALEFAQLWHPPLLEAMRRPFLGRALLGTYFSWSDFPYYVGGSAVGWLWIRALRRSRPPHES